MIANPALSPDASRLAFDSADFKANNVDIWVTDLARSSSSRFTFDPQEEGTPVWSRDGSTIAYRSINGSKIHLKKTGGLDPDKLLSGTDTPSADDILTYESAKSGFRLMLLPAAGGPMRPFLSPANSVSHGQISPDGKWVAYASNETGDWEIYATTFPGAAGKWQVSHGGGAEPRWRGDSKELFCVGPKRMLTAVQVTGDGAFSAGTPRALFEIHSRATISSTDLFTYDVTKDGKRFLVNQYFRPEQILPLEIVFNANAPAAR